MSNLTHSLQTVRHHFNNYASSYLKRFLMVQNFSEALKIGFISFHLSSLEKGC